MSTVGRVAGSADSTELKLLDGRHVKTCNKHVYKHAYDMRMDIRWACVLHNWKALIEMVKRSTNTSAHVPARHAIGEANARHTGVVTNVTQLEELDSREDRRDGIDQHLLHLPRCVVLRVPIRVSTAGAGIPILHSTTPRRVTTTYYSSQHNSSWRPSACAPILAREAKKSKAVKLVL